MIYDASFEIERDLGQRHRSSALQERDDEKSKGVGVRMGTNRRK